MELAARIGTMARRGAPLPYLRRVAYLESHGTEWINTGVNILIGDSLSLYYDYAFKLSAGFLFGSQSESDWGSRFYIILDSGAPSTRLSIGFHSINLGDGSYYKGRFDCTLRDNETEYSIGETFTVPYAIKNQTIPCFLFAKNNYDGITVGTKTPVKVMWFSSITMVTN